MTAAEIKTTFIVVNYRFRWLARGVALPASFASIAQEPVSATSAAALSIVTAKRTTRFACASLSLVRQPEAGQCHAGQADAELLQRRAPRDGLGRAFGEFIELVVRMFPFVLVVPSFVSLQMKSVFVNWP